ncbi:MAG: hypothetical protein CW341_03730 [Bacteroidetes bacterium]|nr:hypothetical protein [Bacteroidota bacterium]
MKKLTATIVLLISSMCISAQCPFKYGATEEDSLECLQQLTNFHMFYKSKEYTDAYKAWQYCINNCPCSWDGLYLRGNSLLSKLIKDENDPMRKERLIDSLLYTWDISKVNFPDKYSKIYLAQKTNIIYNFRREKITSTEELSQLLEMYINAIELGKKKIQSYTWEQYIEIAEEMTKATNEDKYAKEAYLRAVEYNFLDESSLDLLIKKRQITPDQQIKPCPNVATVRDAEGNVYNTLQIGKQCWMKENMRATCDKNGNSIASGTVSSSFTTPYRYYPNNDKSNVNEFGYLYNWEAAMKVCPSGWHLPSYPEWMELVDYLGSQNQYVCGKGKENINKALASTKGWGSCTEECATGYFKLSNNATGFSAMPAGTYNNEYRWFGTVCAFWGSTIERGDYYYFIIGNKRADWDHAYSDNKVEGLSVRCVKD